MIIKIPRDRTEERCEKVYSLKETDSIIIIGKRGGKRVNEIAFARAFIAETGCSFHDDGKFYDSEGQELRPEIMKRDIVYALANLGLTSGLSAMSGRLFRLIRTLGWVETPPKTIHGGQL